MWRWIAVFVMGAVLVAGALFSAYNTFSLFAGIFGGTLSGYLWSAAGLALFDLGALGWLLHFAHSARGNVQRAIAAVCGVSCLVLTLAAAGTHVLLVQSLIAVPEWAGLVAVVAILVALAINLIGAAANHMAAPDVAAAMREQALNDEKAEAVSRAQMAVFREALRQTEARVAETAAFVSGRLSAEFAGDANREMLAMTAGGANTARLPAASRQADQDAAEDDEDAAPVLVRATNGTRRRARQEADAGPK